MVVEPLDDAVEHIAGLIELTCMKQRLPQPQGRRRGLIRMFGERERLAQVSSRLRPLRLILGCPKASSSSRRCCVAGGSPSARFRYATALAGAPPRIACAAAPWSVDTIQGCPEGGVCSR